MLSVNIHLDSGKQFRCFLNLINEYRRRIVFEKSTALLLCSGTNDHIVECCVVHSLCDALKHGGFPNLSWTGNKDRTKHFGKGIDRGLCVPFDILHKASPFG